MIPDADSYSNLPGVLPQWAGGALDRCAEIGIYKAQARERKSLVISEIVSW